MSTGMRTTPMVVSPKMMITTPNQRTTLSWLRSSTDPNAVAPMPSATNTVVNPATNSSAARSVTRRASRRPRSDTGSAET